MTTLFFYHDRRLYRSREGRQAMKRNYTKDVLEVVTTQRFGSKYFDVYGDIQNPLFVAVEVAEMIEIQNTTDLLKRLDDDEKLTYVISRAGQKREMNMLTEFGVYEVLSQSRKPLAKEFKKVVKHILKEIRLKGYYMAGELWKNHRPLKKPLTRWQRQSGIILIHWPEPLQRLKI